MADINDVKYLVWIQMRVFLTANENWR